MLFCFLLLSHSLSPSETIVFLTYCYCFFFNGSNQSTKKTPTQLSTALWEKQVVKGKQKTKQLLSQSFVTSSHGTSLCIGSDVEKPSFAKYYVLLLYIHTFRLCTIVPAMNSYLEIMEVSLIAIRKVAQCPGFDRQILFCCLEMKYCKVASNRLSHSDRPNVRFGRTVRPNFYCAVRPK